MDRRVHNEYVQEHRSVDELRRDLRALSEAYGGYPGIADDLWITRTDFERRHPTRDGQGRSEAVS